MAQLNKCLGYIECREGTCNKACDSPCKPGTAIFRCASEPCSVNRCHLGLTCVNNYCGGCDSINSDAAGNEICHSSPQVNESIMPTESESHSEPMDYRDPSELKSESKSKSKSNSGKSKKMVSNKAKKSKKVKKTKK